MIVDYLKDSWRGGALMRYILPDLDLLNPRGGPSTIRINFEVNDEVRGASFYISYWLLRNAGGDEP